MNTNDLKKERSKTCKLCVRRSNFCKRHAPKASITRSKYYTAEQMERVQKVSYNEGLKRGSEIARREAIYWAVDSPNETVNQGEYVSRRIMEEIKDEII